MFIPLILVVIRTNFQPWYLMLILPFASLIPSKSYAMGAGLILSFFALAQYLPYIYIGDWNEPIPQILLWLTIGGFLIYLFTVVSQDYLTGIGNDKIYYMNLIQKALLKYKLEILIVFGLGILYFLLRLYNIMSLPIFTDEAIYVRWSQIARQDAAWRFISLTDGKQPMFVWIAMNIMRIVDDPLLASRLVSVFAGFFTMIGLFFLANELFKNIRIGLISAFLYVIYPFALVYDRMALYDSLVGMFIIWGLYFEVLLIRRLRLDIALILGMIIGGGILTKTSGFFSIYLLPSTLLLFGFERKNVISKLLKWIILSLITVSVAYGFYFILRLSPFFYIIGEKNALFVYPISEWMMHPFTYLQSNLSGLWNWFITYFTWPVFFFLQFYLFLSISNS